MFSATCKIARILVSVTLFAFIAIGCAGPSEPDDDDKNPPAPTPGEYSVMLEEDELGIAALQVFDGGDSSTVVLSDIGYPLDYDQVIAAVDSMGEFDWYRTLPNGWNHKLFKTDEGWTAVGYETVASQFTLTQFSVTTMGETGGLKRTRTIALPDSLYGNIVFNDVVMTPDGDLLLTGNWYVIDSGDEILDVDAIFARFDVANESFEWVERFGSGTDNTSRWNYGDCIAVSEDGTSAIVAGRNTANGDIRGSLQLIAVDPSDGSWVRHDVTGTASSTPIDMVMLADGGFGLLANDHDEGGQELQRYRNDFVKEWSSSSGSYTYRSLSYAQGQFLIGGKTADDTPFLASIDEVEAITHYYFSLFEFTGDIYAADRLDDGTWFLAGRASETESLSNALSWIARSDSLEILAAPDTVVNVPH